MAGTNVLGGPVQVTVDGEVFTPVDAAKCVAGGTPESMQTEAITATDGTIPGFTQKAVIPTVEVPVAFVGTINVAALQAKDNSVVTVTYANGQVFVLSGAKWSGENEVDSGDGKLPLKFVGQRGSWSR